MAAASVELYHSRRRVLFSETMQIRFVISDESPWIPFPSCRWQVPDVSRYLFSIFNFSAFVSFFQFFSFSGFPFFSLVLFFYRFVSLKLSVYAFHFDVASFWIFNLGHFEESWLHLYVTSNVNVSINIVSIIHREYAKMKDRENICLCPLLIMG